MPTQDTAVSPRGISAREVLAVGLFALLLSALIVGTDRLSSPDTYPLGCGDPIASFFPYLVRSFGDVPTEMQGPWDPTMGTGLPESHSPFGIYYLPLRCLCSLFPLGLAISLSLVLHHALALLGTHLLMRDYGRSCGASLIAGLAFSLGGFLLFRRPFLMMFHACVWLPWILWALERWRSRGTWVWVASAGTLLALHATAIHLQMVVIGGFVWIPYAVWFTTTGEVWSGKRSRFLLGCVTACLLGAIGSLPQTLPFMEVSGWSGYGNGHDRSFYLSGPLDYRHLAGLLNPWIFGGNWGQPMGPIPLALVDSGLFFGVVPLAMALLGLRWKKTTGSDTSGRFWLVLGVLHLLLALGHQGLIYPALGWLPVYNLFHIPARHTWIVSLSLAYFAARGFDRILEAKEEDTPKLLRILLRRLTATTLLGVLTVVLLFRHYTLPPLTYLGFILPVLSILIATGVLAAAIHSTKARLALLVLSVVLTIGELWFNQGSFGFYNVSTAETLDESRHPEALQWIRQQIQDGPLPARCLANVTFEQGLLPDSQGHTAFGPVWGVSLLNSYTQSMPASYHRLLRLESHGVVDFPRVLYEQRGLSISGGRYLVTREMPVIVPGVGYLVTNKEGLSWRTIDNFAKASIRLSPGPQYLIEGVVEPSEGRTNLCMTSRVQGGKGRFPSVSWQRDEIPDGHFCSLMFGLPEDIRLVSFMFGFQWDDNSPVQIKELRIWGLDPRAETSNLPELVKRLNSEPRHPYRLAHECESGFKVFVNDDTRPLACLIREVRTVGKPSEAVDEQLSATAPVRDLAFVACPGGEANGWRPGEIRHFSQGSAKVSCKHPNEFRIATNTEGEGFLVLGVTKTRGWTAEVDGKSIPIHAVDGPLMGVSVPAGEHEVRFRFQPVLAQVGTLAASLGLGGAWLFVLISGVYYRRQRTLITNDSFMESTTTHAAA